MDIEVVEFVKKTRVGGRDVDGVIASDEHYITLEIFGQRDEMREVNIFNSDGEKVAIIPYHNVAMYVPK